jgi:AbrB family looped-hinge helix DNA binding protein
MRTRLSSKGQVVIPQAARDKLQLRPGDPLEARVEADRIILIPGRRPSPKPRIVRDSVTGLPVLAARSNAPRLTGKQVKQILADFP